MPPFVLANLPPVSNLFHCFPDKASPQTYLWKCLVRRVHLFPLISSKISENQQRLQFSICVVVYYPVLFGFSDVAVFSILSNAMLNFRLNILSSIFDISLFVKPESVIDFTNRFFDFVGFFLDDMDDEKQLLLRLLCANIKWDIILICFFWFSCTGFL